MYCKQYRLKYVILGAVFFANAALAQVPEKLGYQGRLLNAKDGTPLEGTTAITFRLFDSETGGNNLWEEKQPTVVLTDGFYETFLGEVTPFGGGVIDGHDRYLEVQIGSDPPLVPRQPIGSVPYAVRAGNAVNVVGGTVNTTSLTMGGKSITALYSAGSGITIDSNETISLFAGCARGEILKWSGSAWACGPDLTSGGTVTTINTGPGLTGGPISGNGTIGIAAGGVANEMLTHSTLTVTAGPGLQGGGQISLGGATTLSVVNPGGDLSGFAPSTVVGIQGAPLAPTPPKDGQVLKFDANKGMWIPAEKLAAGDVTNNLLANSTITVKAGAGLTGGGSVALGASTTLAVGPEGGDLSGTYGSTTLAKIQGKQLAAAAPADGQVLKFDATNSQWAPSVDNNSGGTVTSIATGAGLAGGPITGSGTISIPNGAVTNAMLVNSAVTLTAGTGLSGGGTTALGSGGVTLNNTGILTLAAIAPLSVSGGQTALVALSGTVPIANGGTGITAAPSASGQYLRSGGSGTWGVGRISAGDLPNPGGDLSGYAPATVVGVQGVAVSTIAPASGQVLKFDATNAQWTPSTDNNSGGTVTSIATGAGLAGGPITGSGTISIPNSAVTNAMLVNSTVTLTAGTGLSGGGTTALGSGGVTLNNTGILTLAAIAPLSVSGGQAALVALSGTVPIANGGTGITAAPTASGQYLRSGAAGAWGVGTITAGDMPPEGGDLSGAYGSATLAKIQGKLLAAAAPGDGQVLKFDAVGGKWQPSVDNNSGGTVTSIATGAGLAGGPITGSGTISIPNSAVTNAMLVNSAVTLTAGTGLSGGGTTSLGSGGVTLSNTGILSLAATGPLSVSGGQAALVALSGTVPIANGGTGITAAPTASGQYLRSSGSGAWAVGTISAGDLPAEGGDVTGAYGNSTVAKIQNQPVVSTTPTDGQILKYNGTNKNWALVSDPVPAGAVMSFNLAACPAGWSELVAARGRYLVGLPSGGTLGNPVGQPLSDGENRAVGKHNHTLTDPGHTHPVPITNAGTAGSIQPAFGNPPAAGSGSTDSQKTGITLAEAGTVAGTNAPYLELLVCQKN